MSCLSLKQLHPKASSLNIDHQLPGTYEYLNVDQLFNLPFDYSLNIICPPKLMVNASQTTHQFRVQIGNGSHQTGEYQCHVDNNEVVLAVLDRVQAGNFTLAQNTTTPATLLDLENHFPTFLGNFSDHPFICPILQTPVRPTYINVKDTGYLYTIVNHYKSNGFALGTDIVFLNWSDFEEFRSTYSIRLTILDDVLSCTYVPAEDKTRLMAQVSHIQNPQPSPSSEHEDINPSSTPESSSPSPSPSPSSDISTCFPRDARVRLLNGSTVAMADLRVGDVVQDGPTSFSKVILFTHADDKAKARFVNIKTDVAEVVLTPSHFIYINDKLLPASDARAGDKISTISDCGHLKHVRITDVSILAGDGLYNPHTISGDIAVVWKGDAVLTSTYTTAVSPRLAHALIFPLCLLGNRLGTTFPFVSRVFERGNYFWRFVLRSVEWTTNTLGHIGYGKTRV